MADKKDEARWAAIKEIVTGGQVPAKDKQTRDQIAKEKKAIEDRNKKR